jgi:hypothetical protein
MIGQWKSRISSQIIFITLFSSRCFAALFTSLSKLSTYAGEKPFSWANPAYVDFSSTDFNVQLTYWVPVGMPLRSIALDVSKWCEALESYGITLCNNCFFSSLCTLSPPNLSNNCSAYHLRHIIVLSQLPSSFKKSDVLMIPYWTNLCGPTGSFVSLYKFQTYLEL